LYFDSNQVCQKSDYLGDDELEAKSSLFNRRDRDHEDQEGARKKNDSCNLLPPKIKH